MKRKVHFKFRWLATVLMLLVVGSSLILSCQDEETSIKLQDGQDEGKSEIALIEEEIGIKLFKQELTISDEKGENKVTIRIAAIDEFMLTEFLKYRTFSIEPIYEHKKKSTVKITPQQNEESAATVSYDYESTAMIEVVNQELKEGVIGIGFRNNVNQKYKFDPSGRTKYLNLVTHTSGNWPSVLAFQAYAHLNIEIDFKGRWYQRWYPVYGPAAWCCYEFADFDVDGPYRARLWVDYDYTGDYYYEWFY